MSETAHPSPPESSDRTVGVVRPWGPFEALSGATVGPCEGSMGEYGTPCPKAARWVQRTLGVEETSEVRYCDDHRKKQEVWDKILYDSKPAKYVDPGPEWWAEVQKLLSKIGRKKKKREEPQEIDPS